MKKTLFNFVCIVSSFFLVATFLLARTVPERIEVVRSKPTVSGFTVAIECRREDGWVDAIEGSLSGAVAYTPRVCLYPGNSVNPIMEHEIGYGHDTKDSALSFIKSATFDEGSYEIVVVYDGDTEIRIPVVRASAFR